MILFRHLQNEYVADFLKPLQFACDYYYYLQKAQQQEGVIAENVQSENPAFVSLETFQVVVQLLLQILF